MCLKSQLTVEQLKLVTPKRSFKAWKFVQVENNELVSPHFHYVWKVGEHKTDGEGFYVTYFKPGEIANDGNKRLEVTVNPKDINKGGSDIYGGYVGTCFVCKKVTVSQKQYDEAMGIKKEAHIKKGKELLTKMKEKKVSKKVVAKKKKTTSLVRKLIKKVKKATKKAAKKRK